MSQPNSPILDYASPRASHPLRLPTSSTVRLEQSDSNAIISEFLAARSGAVAAIVFACMILLIYLAWIVHETEWCVRQRSFDRFPWITILFWSAYASLMLYVINDTWARMTLTVQADSVQLKFLSPFRKRMYAWPADQIAEITARRVSLLGVPARDGPAPAAGELLITIRNGQPVQLLCGHDFYDIDWMCAQLRHILWPKKSA